MQWFKSARRWFWLGPIVLGIVFAAGGVYMMAEGRAAKDDVRDALARENITTSEDASIPNVPVDDAETAEAEADVIEKHVLEITGGKRYAELERDDPNRAVVLNSVTLRSALNLAIMGFRVSDLVVGMGAFMVVAGLMNALFLAPAVYYASRVADRLDEGRP
jgi:hypothetical protein